MWLLDGKLRSEQNRVTHKARRLNWEPLGTRRAVQSVLRAMTGRLHRRIQCGQVFAIAPLTHVVPTGFAKALNAKELAHSHPAAGTRQGGVRRSPAEGLQVRQRSACHLAARLHMLETELHVGSQARVVELCREHRKAAHDRCSKVEHAAQLQRQHSSLPLTP